MTTHPSLEEREIIMVAVALTRARRHRCWAGYLRAMNFELEWYFHRPFYEI